MRVLWLRLASVMWSLRSDVLCEIDVEKVKKVRNMCVYIFRYIYIYICIYICVWGGGGLWCRLSSVLVVYSLIIFHYGVATISRLLRITGLFCRISSLS